jgi:RNA polymerase sigma-70 factor (ECF subfamily)
MSRQVLHEPAGEAARDRLAFERVRAGDALAFEALFLAYYRRLCLAVDRYVHAPDIAEEIVRDVFMRIWQQRATLPATEDVRGYLYAAARNRARDHLKHERVVERSRRGVGADHRPPGMGESPAAPDAQLEAQELRAAIEHALSVLPDRVREAVVLQRQHGLSYAEIAGVMGISVSTVEKHIIAALKALRKSIAGFRLL